MKLQEKETLKMWKQIWVTGKSWKCFYMHSRNQDIKLGTVTQETEAGGLPWIQDQTELHYEEPS